MSDRLSLRGWYPGLPLWVFPSKNRMVLGLPVRVVNAGSGLKTKSGDTAYYSRITEGTNVKIFPFHVGWKMGSATDLLSKVTRVYDAGADGIAVWDPNQFEAWQSGKNPYWPLVSRLGHREQLRDGSLLYKPVATPLTRLGENQYSRWYPNTGF